jgi:hypothetical protein
MKHHSVDNYEYEGISRFLCEDRVMAQFRDLRQVADFNFGVILTELCMFYRKLTVNGYKRTIKLLIEIISKFMRATNSQLLGGLIMTLLQEIQQLEKKFMSEVSRLEVQKRDGIGTPGTPSGYRRGVQQSPAGEGPPGAISSMSKKMPNLFFSGAHQQAGGGTPSLRQSMGNAAPGTPIHVASPVAGGATGGSSTVMTMEEMKWKMRKFFTKVRYIMTNCGHYNRYYSKSKPTCVCLAVSDTVFV